MVCTDSRLCVGPADGGMSDLLQELNPLPLLLLPQPLPPLSLLEALTEGVGVVKVDLQVVETETTQCVYLSDTCPPQTLWRKTETSMKEQKVSGFNGSHCRKYLVT